MRSSWSASLLAVLMLLNAPARLGGILVDQVQADAGLHVHERDVVREYVVQFLGQFEPLLAGASLRLFGPRSLDIGELRSADPDEFGDGEDHAKPPSHKCDVQDARTRGTRVDIRGGDEGAVGEGSSDQDLATRRGLHGEEERHGDAEEYRSIRIAACDVHVDRSTRHGHGDQRLTLCPEKRDRTEKNQRNCKDIEGIAIDLFVRGAERSDDLKDADGDGA